MIQMVCARSIRVASKTGHILLFKANEPRPVPQEAVRDAMAMGCAPVEVSEQVLADDLSRANVEFTGDLRRSILHLALKVIADENNPKQFNAGGRPKTDAVEERVGFPVSSKEMQAAWQNYLSNRHNQEFALHPNAENVMAVLSADNPDTLKALAAQFGKDKKVLDGMTTRDMRKALLAEFSELG